MLREISVLMCQVITSRTDNKADAIKDSKLVDELSAVINFVNINIYTRVGDNSGRVFFEFPRCMSLAQYSINCFVIRYKILVF